MDTSTTIELKRILKHSSIYSLSNILSRVVGFVMIPVYTRFLSPADYGVLELISITLVFIGIVLSVGITEAISRFYFDYKDPKKQNTVISTGLIGFMAVAIFSFIVLYPLSGMMAEVILGDSADGLFFSIAIGYLCTGFVIQVALAYMRITHRSLQYSIVSVAGLIIALSLNILLVVVIQMGVKGILLATLISQLAQVLYLVPMVFKGVGFSFDFGIFKSMFRFGFPLIFSQISHQITTASDRYFLKNFSNLAETGLYSLGYKMGTLVTAFVATPFDMIWTPRRFQYFGNKDYDQIFSKIFTYFFLIITLIGLYISILIKDILRILVTQPFWDAYKIVPIITLTYVLYSIYYHFNIGILMKKKTRLYAGINIATGILNLILNYFLIRAYSIWGAAIATLICYIFKPAIAYYYSNKLYPIVMETRRLAIILADAILVYFLCSLIETNQVFANLALKSLAGLMFLFLLYIIRFFSEDEILKGKELFRSGMAKIGINFQK